MSEKRCIDGDKCQFRHVEAEGMSSKKSKKGGAKGSVAMLKESIQLGCVYQDSCPRQSILSEPGKLGSKLAVIFPKGTWHQIRIRERKGPSRGIIQKRAPHERSPCTPKFRERSHEETLHLERCARKAAWVWQNIYKLKNSEKATFYTAIESRVMPAPTSKRPEERNFAVDSGASMHTMSKKLSPDELDTLRRSRTPIVELTATGDVHIHEEAQVFRSRSKSVRNCAITRGNASSPVARQALRRSRILL